MFDSFFLRGAKGIRTLDPLIANQVLSQLSYNPICMEYSNTFPEREKVK
jgi:hypothetical protein